MDASPITLGREGQRRLYVLNELAAGRLTIVEAALALDVSIRHLKRLKARYRGEGIAAPRPRQPRPAPLERRPG